MDILAGIGAGLLAAGCGCWAFMLLTTAHNLRRMRRVETVPLPERDAWPRVSVVVPACNEGESLGAALQSHLRGTYPNLEFIVVNDRSTDNTGEIADALARTDPRLRVVHLHELPEGWLGKVHALHRGVRESTGEWLLFMDADVHVAPGTLERVVVECEARGLDQALLLPRLEAANLGMGMVNAFLVRSAATLMPVWAVEHPRLKVAAGGGVFCLLRREALDRTPGMARLRLEVIDDASLAYLLKAYGARGTVMNGSGGVSLCWYRSLGAFTRGIEKNGFAAARYSLPALAAACFFLILLDWAPLLALAQPAVPWLRAAGACALIVQLGVSAVVARWARGPILPALLSPLAVLVMSFALLRSAALTLRRGGIVWRGTEYPLPLLREFMRNGKNMPLPPGPEESPADAAKPGDTPR